MTRFAVLVIVLGAAAVPGTPVAAQIGSSGLHFDATGVIVYDSNQLRSQAAPTGTGVSRPRDDVRYSPALAASYGRNTGRLSLAVNGLVGYDFFQNNGYLNRNRFGGGGSLGYRSGSRCSAQINGNYVSRQNGTGNIGFNPLDDPSLIDPLPDDVGRLINNGQIFTTYGINANCASPGGRLSFGGSATQSQINNQAPTRRFANSRTETYSGNVGLGVLRPGQLSLNGSYSTINYPNRSLVPGLGSGFGGVATYRVGVSYTRPIGTKLTGTIGAAYLTARPSGGQSPYTSPAYNASLSYVVGPRLVFDLAASRDIVPSQTAGALFRVIDNGSLRATYKFGKALSTNAAFGLLHNVYRQSFATVDQPIARRNDVSKTFSIGANYAPRPLYDVGVSVTQISRTSTPSIFNYSSTRASLTLAIHI